MPRATISNFILNQSHACFCLLCAGIVHGDLKPANFVIVNATLKLIDFGIASRIQPDVTSIMKDTQVRAVHLEELKANECLTYK